MTEHDSDVDDLQLALALRRLDGAVIVPPADPAREAALMAAFDAAVAVRAGGRTSTRQYWGMAGLATAAALLIAVGGGPLFDRQSTRPAPGERRDAKGPPSEFVIVPGALGLPAMESGSLVRVELPVSMLPSLGVTPPPGAVARVKADVIVGQDGLTRAVRLVN